MDMKIFMTMLLLVVSSWGLAVVDKYPSYSYVFSEFDVDRDYINDDEFKTFLKKHHKQYERFYKNSLKRGGHLIPTFKSMLMRDELSDLFVYMSMIESGFKTDAVSNKSAVGIWQFMEATAKQYKLTVNSDFDERLDPVLATSAAMNYLHKLHKDFGKWYLAVMAYNCGEGRLQKAIKKAGTDEISTLLSDTDAYLPKETRNYLKKILLVAMIGENVSLGLEHMGGAVEQLYGKDVVQVEIEPGESLEHIAKMIKMKPKDLLKLNHHFKDGVVPVKLPSYKMNIPNMKIVDFYAIYTLQKELQRTTKTHYLSHIVTTETSLSQIAKKYDTGIGEIAISNPAAQGAVKKGDTLVIPVTQKVFDKFSDWNH